ncbi:MAG: hypothetical protein LBB51_02890 [Zoogloeaceae bacterium]|nr:hypothetical protein [Zoogloeaceae bacterium]
MWLKVVENSNFSGISTPGGSSLRFPGARAVWRQKKYLQMFSGALANKDGIAFRSQGQSWVVTILP